VKSHPETLSACFPGRLAYVTREKIIVSRHRVTMKDEMVGDARRGFKMKIND